MFPGSGASRTALYYWLSAGLCCLFLAATVQYVRAEKAIDRANDVRLNSYLLADELRQSSDDLTRMVRSYVATGDPRFKRQYLEILEIREGRKPRPLEPANVYWDLVADDEARPRGFGTRAALIDLARGAGFTATEIDKLAEAKSASDELTRTEFSAMSLVDSSSPVSDATRLRAVNLLEDAAYRAAKARVMRPIAEFHRLSFGRTLAQVKNAQALATTRRWYSVLLGVSFLLSYLHLLVTVNAEKREKAANYRLFRAIFDHAGVGLARVSASGRLEDVNQEFCRTLGYAASQLLAKDFTLERLFLAEDRAPLRAQMAAITDGNRSGTSVSLRCVHRSGRILWVNLSVHGLTLSRKDSPTLILALFDTTGTREAAAELENHRAHLEELVEERTLELEAGNQRLKREVFAREQAVEALQESEGRFRFLAENSADVIWTMDIQTRALTYMSPSVSTLLGYSASEASQKPLTASFTPDSAKRFEDALHQAIERFSIGDHGTQVIEVDQLHQDGRLVHTEVVTTLHADECGSPTSVLGVTRNITQRRTAEEAIRQLAFYDGLTKLPNRRLLEDRLKQSILRARRDGSRLAVLFIDLDKFKPVNDAYGHQVGDWLLCHAAMRLQSCLRDSDTAARIGGDEFVVLLPDLAQVEDALLVAERIRLSIEKPFTTGTGETLHISSSIGVASYPEDAATDDALLRLGDEAMYQAKNLGRNQVRMIAPCPRAQDSGQGASAATSALIQLSWRSAYACGDALIDAEHRELFALANRLFNAALSPDQAQDFFSLLDKGLTLIERHFAHEEDALRACNYPRLDEHMALHRSLLQHSQSLRVGIASNTLTLGQLVDFVGVEVIARHLLLADREYFQFLGRRQHDGAPIATH